MLVAWTSVVPEGTRTVSITANTADMCLVPLSLIHDTSSSDTSIL